MATIQRNDGVLGATVHGLDLSQPIDDGAFRVVLGALGQHGVLRIPGQSIDAAALKAFASRFGTLEVNVANTFQEPGHPDVMILSNIVRVGKPIGLSDAGQDWHTDMSYSRSIPGRILGYGQFIMESAGQDQALHDINWVPDPDHTYRAICAEMFGVDDHDRVRVGSDDDDTAASTTGEDPAHLAPDPSWSDPSWSDPSWSDASRSAVVEDHGSHSRAIPVHRLDAEGRSSHRSDERRRPGAGADTGPLPVIRPRGDD